MNVCLISTPTRTSTPNCYPPLGILMLASHLERLGHRVRILDAAQHRWNPSEIVARIKEFGAELVGLSGIITSYAYMINLSRAIKRGAGNVPIVIGGQVTINNTENCFRHMDIDFLVKGYGEIALQKIVLALENKEQFNRIPGIAFRQNSSMIENPGREYFASMDEVPLPAYHHLDVDYYSTLEENNILEAYLKMRGKSVPTIRSFPLLAALGCVGKCSFCVHEQEYVGVKYFSMEYLRNHIQLLHEKYGINDINIGGEYFIRNSQHAEEFNLMMSEFFPDVYWRTITRADILSSEAVATLSSGNCYSINFGFESGSQRILKLMNKKTTVAQNIQAYKEVDRSGLNCNVNFIVGHPGEDKQTIEETLHAVADANVHECGVFYATPYPGGRLWDWALENGVITDVHQYLMHISNQDASRFIVNLTPHPDLIVRIMYVLVNNKGYFEAWKKKRLGSSLISALIFRHRRIVVPVFLLRMIYSVYFLLLPLLHMLIPSLNDKKFQFNIDEHGALLPRTCIKKRPQTSLTAKQLDEIFQYQSQIVIELGPTSAEAGATK